MPAAKTAYVAHTTASVMNDVPIHGSAPPITGRNRRLAPSPAIATVASAARSWRRRSVPGSGVRMAASSQAAPTTIAASRAATHPQKSAAPEMGPSTRWGGATAIGAPRSTIVGMPKSTRTQ